MKTFLLIALIIAFAQIAFLTKLRTEHVPSNKKISFVSEQKNNFVFLQNNKNIVVIYNSSGKIQAGFAGEMSPRSDSPNIVGIPKHKGVMVGMNDKDFYFGHEAEKKSGTLTIIHPIEYGYVKNWELMKNVWKHTLINELGVILSDDTNVLITKQSLITKDQIEMIAKIMFETLEVKSLYIVDEAALSLYATSRKTGMVILVQYDLIQFVPIYEGSIYTPAVKTLQMGRNNIKDYFEKLLGERNYYFNTLEKKLLTDMIEKLGYVAFDYDNEIIKSKNTSSGIETNYGTNDKVIKLGNERFRAFEILFKPSIVGRLDFGIHQIIYNVIMNCPDFMRKELYANIVLSDEDGIVPGFKERLTKEISNLAPGMEVNVIAPPNSKNLSWIGGSMFASKSGLIAFMEMTRDEYFEEGNTYVHRKTITDINI